ncbi:FecR family protein [Sinomicrobium sp. M5D2P9]
MKNLVTKLLTGTITEEEKGQLYKLLKNPDNRKVLEEYIRDDHDLNLAVQKNDVNTALTRVMKEIGHKPGPVRKLFPGILKYAALAVVLLGLGFLCKQYFLSGENREGLVPKNEFITIDLGNGQTRTIDPSKNGQLTGTKGNVVAMQQQDLLSYASDGTGKEEEYNTLKIPYGKRFSVELSDGTIVHLNAGTELKYPVRFSKQDQRKVSLKGEAFFEVSEDKEHPFIVNAETLDVKVLGTKFNVSVYPEDEVTDVVLLEGAVAMSLQESDSSSATILAPGNKGTLHHTGKTISVTEVSTGIYTAWMNGELVFRSMPFDDILKKLERHYNVEIENTNASLGKELFNAAFNEVPIDSVLSFFSDVHKINFEIKDNKVFIR